MQRSRFVLAVVLVIAVAGNAFFWNYFYVDSFQSGYDSGFLSGIEVGYKLGYDTGNQSGYELGFVYGYDNGNASGYQTGFDNGYSDGFDDGIVSGYLNGYDTGYDNGYDTGYGIGYPAGFYDGNETGFSDGYVQGVEDGAGTGYTIRDPTYDEAIDFTSWDKTNENEYSENYTCHHFTADFKNNAFQAGYRCGYVYVEFVDVAHAIVCFNTTDSGVIFIEPQLDDIMTLTIGEPYWDRSEYEPPDYDDTIVSFNIIW